MGKSEICIILHILYYVYSHVSFRSRCPLDNWLLILTALWPWLSDVLFEDFKNIMYYVYMFIMNGCAHACMCVLNFVSVEKRKRLVYVMQVSASIFKSWIAYYIYKRARQHLRFRKLSRPTSYWHFYAFRLLVLKNVYTQRKADVFQLANFCKLPSRFWEKNLFYKKKCTNPDIWKFIRKGFANFHTVQMNNLICRDLSLLNAV